MPLFLAHSNASKNKDIKILALRLDMSYAIDDIFIDKYTKIINNQKYRFYCNEMEILMEHFMLIFLS